MKSINLTERLQLMKPQERLDYNESAQLPIIHLDEYMRGPEVIQTLGIAALSARELKRLPIGPFLFLSLAFPKL